MTTPPSQWTARNPAVGGPTNKKLKEGRLSYISGPGLYEHNRSKLTSRDIPGQVLSVPLMPKSDVAPDAMIVSTTALKIDSKDNPQTTSHKRPT